MPNDADLLLPVFLRQKRNYVQGTQIIARCSDVLDGSDWVFCRAQFNTITDHLVAVGLDQPDTAHLGNVHFQRADETRVFYLQEANQPAPKMDTALPIKVARITLSGDDDTVYSYAKASSLEDMLNIVVQSVKSEHEHRYEGAKDIWLTGMRNTKLKCRPDFAETSGKISLSLFRHMGRDQQYQTIWNFGIRPKGAADVITGVTTFAYKTDTHPDAN